MVSYWNLIPCFSLAVSEGSGGVSLGLLAGSRTGRGEGRSPECVALSASAALTPGAPCGT